MSVQGTRSRRKAMAEINVVPYIDVMLVLLIIFMVTAPMLTQGVSVELPQTTSEPIPTETGEPLIVSVDANGAYFLEMGDDRSNPMELGDLIRRAGVVLEERPDADVYVRGDRHVRYEVIIRLMSALQGVGATRVGLITEPLGD